MKPANFPSCPRHEFTGLIRNQFIQTLYIQILLVKLSTLSWSKNISSWHWPKIFTNQMWAVNICGMLGHAGKHDIEMGLTMLRVWGCWVDLAGSTHFVFSFYILKYSDWKNKLKCCLFCLNVKPHFKEKKIDFGCLKTGPWVECLGPQPVKLWGCEVL